MRSLTVLAAALLAHGVFGQQGAVLTPGTPIERKIQPGEVHTYRLPVQAGQFVHVTAAQLGADVAIRLIQPDGNRFAQVDRLLYEGVEDVPWIATIAGDCVVEIRARAGSKAGSYRVEAGTRAPTEQERSRVAAFTACWIDGPRLRAKQTAAASREAALKYELAVAEWRKAGDRRWEAYALSEWAQVLRGLGDHEKAKNLMEQSLSLRRGLDERFSLSVALNNLASVYTALGTNQRAIELLGEAIEIRRQAGDRVGEATAIHNLGIAYKYVNREKAIEYLTQALSIRTELGERATQAVTLSALGDMHYIAGDYQSALERFTDSWKLRIGSGDRRAEANAAYSLGSVYYSLGNAAQAQEYFKRAESLFRQIGDERSVASTLYAMGMLHQRRSDHVAAIRSYEEALALHQKTSLGTAAVNDLSAMCRSLVAAGQPEKARERATLGIEASRKIGYMTGSGSSLQCRGRLELALGNYEQARADFSEALEFSRQAQNREDQAQTLTDLAELERRRDKFADALRHIEQATALMEVGRAQVDDPNMRASYRAARSDRVDLHAELLMQMHAKDPKAGHAERAFNVTEQWRARSLAEMIGESRAELRRELTPEQRQREDKLLASISSVQRELFREGVLAERQQQLKQQLSAAERDIDLFQMELRRGGNRYAAGQYAKPLDAQQVRSQMLDPGTVLIEYSLGAQQSYAWALTDSGVLSAVLAPRKEIETRVEAYRKLLAQRANALTVTTALARVDAEGKQLYQMLVAPLEETLASKTRVVIVPDGALSYLPFEALPGRSRMIERFSVSYAPSASTLAALRVREEQRPAPERMLLAFADPAFAGAANSSPVLADYLERGFTFTRLPNTRTEVAGIRSLFRPDASRVYLGGEAREQLVKTEKLENYRYVHFAAHGYFDEEQPARSGIVLSSEGDSANDGVLQAPEIMRLRLNADLVTLSACQTGLGKLLAGEGVMGLTRAFFYAGAQSLVVSLWNVNDAATSELMKRFYSNLKSGMARDEALRQAKLSLMKTPNSSWRHPYFWAPFVFVGERGK